MNLLLIIGIILLILWALGLFAFSLGGLVHISPGACRDTDNNMAAEGSLQGFLGTQSMHPKK